MRASFIATLVVVASAFAPALCAPLEYVFVLLNYEISADLFVDLAPHVTWYQEGLNIPPFQEGRKTPTSILLIPILMFLTATRRMETTTEDVAVHDVDTADADRKSNYV